MICKISILLLAISFCVLIDGKSLLHDNDLELSNDKAQMFLRSILNDDDDDDRFIKRESGKNCIPCKFKLNPCCPPNICVKKFFWNECMEIKTATGK
jgi:hypothetical protein